MKERLLKNPSNGAGDLSDGDFKRQLLATLGAVRDGDFSARLPSDWTGLDGKVADTVNQIASRKACGSSANAKNVAASSDNNKNHYHPQWHAVDGGNLRSG